MVCCGIIALLLGICKASLSIMIAGIRLKAHPTVAQRKVLAQWMGCAKTIWNAKCEDERYHARFARKYYPIGTYAPIDQSFAQYKHPELTPWLSDCPSQILRNSATNWYKTYRRFIKGECGKPKRKQFDHYGSIYLTRELFQFVKCDDGVERLFIGTKANNIGFLSVKNHKKYNKPKSLYIKRQLGNYTVSFCYDEGEEHPLLPSNKEHLDYLREASDAFLAAHVVGVDRGVARPVQAGAQAYDFTDQQKAKQEKKAAYIKRHQKRLARQVKGSNRRNKTKVKIGKAHRKLGNIRNDFCHKTSRKLVDAPTVKVIVFEDLRAQSMTRRPKPKQNIETGRFEKNNARQKAGLNKTILNIGWHKLECYTQYKANRAGKAFFKVPARHTSQECAACGHIHPKNRQTQEKFVCLSCGNEDNADRNASLVIKKRAIGLIKHSGTELSKRGVLRLDTGRGARSKTIKAAALIASGDESSKKKRKAAAQAVA